MHGNDFRIFEVAAVEPGIDDKFDLGQQVL